MKLPVYWTRNSITNNRIKSDYLLESRIIRDFPKNSIVVHLSKIAASHPSISVHVSGDNDKMIAHLQPHWRRATQWMYFSGALEDNQRDYLNQLIEVIELAKTVAYSAQSSDKKLEKALTW